MRLHRPQSDRVSSPITQSLYLGTAPSAGKDRRRGGHHDGGVTEECRKISNVDTDPMTPFHLPLEPTPSLSATQSKLSEPATVARAPGKHFLQICAGHSAPLSVAAVKAELAVLVPLDADSRLGEEAHDLTGPDVVDKVLRLARSGSVGFAAGETHAATRTQRLQKIFCSTETSLPFSLPSGPLAATSCGFAHHSAQQFIGILCKISCPT